MFCGRTFLTTSLSRNIVWNLVQRTNVSHIISLWGRTSNKSNSTYPGVDDNFAQKKLSRPRTNIFHKIYFPRTDTQSKVWTRGETTYRSTLPSEDKRFTSKSRKSQPHDETSVQHLPLITKIYRKSLITIHTNDANPCPSPSWERASSCTSPMVIHICTKSPLHTTSTPNQSIPPALLHNPTLSFSGVWKICHRISSWENKSSGKSFTSSFSPRWRDFSAARRLFWLA